MGVDEFNEEIIMKIEKLKMRSASKKWKALRFQFSLRFLLSQQSKAQ